MTAANCSPAVASRRAKYNVDFRVPTLLVHSHSIIPRARRQRATHIVDMEVEPKEGGKLAHGCQKPILPVRAKTRRQTTTPDGTTVLLCMKNPGRRQTAIFPARCGLSQHRKRTVSTSGEEPSTSTLFHPHNKILRRYTKPPRGSSTQRKPTNFRDHATPFKCLPLQHSPTPRPPTRRITRLPTPLLSSRFDSSTRVHFCPQ
jgi:hypothetical protein